METDETANGNPPNGALSIYGQADAAMDDFPVLKAFQQYIDAEQSKARKRMILLCMFFGVLMTILVAVFVLVLGQMNRDKQQANEQLIQFLMKERDRVPTPAPVPQPAIVQPAPSPANDAALKAMTETLNALKEEMAQQRKEAEEEAERAPSKAELERERKAELEAEKIRKAQSQLAEEKRRLADEKERLRQQEIERQRRRLYPEYYAHRDAPVVRTPAPAPTPVQPRRELTDADIDDILREVDALQEEDRRKAAAPAKSAKPSAKPAPAKPSATKKDGAKKDDKPIEYFNDSEYVVPVTVNGEDAGFTIPL